MFSLKEKERRFSAIEKIMQEEGLSALLAIGNGCVGTNAYGCFRYLTATKVYYYLQCTLFPLGRAPIGITTSPISRDEMRKGGFVQDCRVYSDQVQGIIDCLTETEITEGRIGTCLDILPESWALELEQAFPGLELVDVSEPIFRVRNKHSQEEIDLIRKCGKLADAGYAAVLEHVKSGMTEQQVIAELEYATQSMGAEYNFSLIASGPFSLQENGLPCIRAATMFNRTVEQGDCIAMEITPRYEGYWTQLVRTVSVGKPNADFVQMHQASCDIIDGTLPELRPGNPIGNIALRIRQLTEEKGYVFAFPCGHICGNDLNEERLVPDNDRLLEPGMVVILHPSVITPEISSGIFWGQTYLITENGYEPLMESSNELMSIDC